VTVPSAFDAILGQEKAVACLKELLASGRVPPALLFTGPRGVGRATTARAFALAASCDRGSGCGECPACRANRFGEGCRVFDIAALFSDEGEKNRVRALRVELAAHASAHALRFLVIIVENAPLMNDSMQAAFLKSIEEPPVGVCYVLIVESPTQLLPTIRSRALTVRFRPLSDDLLERILFEEGRPTPASDAGSATAVEAVSDAGFVSLADGSLERARELIAAGMTPHELVRKHLLDAAPGRMPRRDLLERLLVAIPVAAKIRPEWSEALLDLDRAIAANAHIGLALSVFRRRIAKTGT
jgi:DNA polymerase-3 subunit delta'